MFYKQSVNHTEMVILCLDGGILDLNRLRYNYFNRICKQYNHTISKEEFTIMLGNGETMYNQSPIYESLKDQNINALIEKDLYEYAKLKQNIKKDGVDELLQFFKQKNIKVVVLSTHKTKRAIQYLQLTRIYQYVDFVIGGDSQHLPLPNPSILHTICTQMNVAKENTVVVANFPSLVEAAGDIFMNIVYMQDLVPATANISARVYKTVKNNLEMINVFLFSKYDTVEMYSSVLGMSKEMDLATLEKTYQRLLVEYQDDLQLIALVKRTYRFFLMEVNDQVIESKKAKSLETSFTPEVTKEEINPLTNTEKLTNAVDKTLSQQEIDEEILPEVLSPESVLVSNESLDTAITNMPKSFEQEATTINQLMNKINKTSDDHPVKEEIQDDNKEIDKYDIIAEILDFIYTLMMSFIVSAVAMISYVVVGDYLQRKGVITSFINTLIDFYFIISRGVYTILFDGLHAIIGFVPDYQSLLQGNELLSPLVIEVIMFSVFNVLIYYIVKALYHLINKGRGVID